MYSEDALLPISALQHLLFCKRQCALIHNEQQWKENWLTAEGRLLHDKVDAGERELRGDICIVRSLALRSFFLGLTGKSDVVEFHKVSNESPGVSLPNLEGLWVPVPVEYKRGKPKQGNFDLVQLCAQAICLEEMLVTRIPFGFIYYGQPKKRYQILLEESLRQITIQAAKDLHQLILSRETPKAQYEKKCDSCSLYDKCLPKLTGNSKSVSEYIQRAFKV